MANHEDFTEIILTSPLAAQIHTFAVSEVVSIELKRKSTSQVVQPQVSPVYEFFYCVDERPHL